MPLCCRTQSVRCRAITYQQWESFSPWWEQGELFLASPAISYVLDQQDALASWQFQALSTENESGSCLTIGANRGESSQAQEPAMKPLPERPKCSHLATSIFQSVQCAENSKPHRRGKPTASTRASPSCATRMPQLLEYLFDHHESLRCLPQSFTSCGFCSDECVDGPRKLHVVLFQLLRETERSAVRPAVLT